jgi:hypothetical protein
MATSNGGYVEACMWDRIYAMRSHEEDTARCRGYLTLHVNATCWKLMVDWFFAVVEALDLSRETVGAAMSIIYYRPVPQLGKRQVA